jgi:hypothetical protein
MPRSRAAVHTTGSATWIEAIPPQVDAGRVALEQVRAEPTQRVTHLTYAVRQR